jgi:uncharacterized protein (UPF0262 family)
VDDWRKIVNIYLDETTVPRRSPEQEHDRAVAIYDLIEENHFVPAGDLRGPFVLHIGIEENRLRFGIHDEADQPLTSFTLPLSSFRSVIKDYFTVLESYYEAIKTASASRIEAIDVGRRGLHDEGAEILRERLAEHVEIDFVSARRLFTLICVLHIR